MWFASDSSPVLGPSGCLLICSPHAPTPGKLCLPGEELYSWKSVWAQGSGSKSQLCRLIWRWALGSLFICGSQFPLLQNHDNNPRVYSTWMAQHGRFEFSAAQSNDLEKTYLQESWIRHLASPQGIVPIPPLCWSSAWGLWPSVSSHTCPSYASSHKIQSQTRLQ